MRSPSILTTVLNDPEAAKADVYASKIRQRTARRIYRLCTTHTTRFCPLPTSRCSNRGARWTALTSVALLCDCDHGGPRATTDLDCVDRFDFIFEALGHSLNPMTTYGIFLSCVCNFDILYALAVLRKVGKDE